MDANIDRIMDEQFTSYILAFSLFSLSWQQLYCNHYYYLVSLVCQQLFLQVVSLGNTGPEPVQLLLELGDGHLPVQLHRLQHLQLCTQLSVLQLSAAQVGLHM